LIKIACYIKHKKSGFVKGKKGKGMGMGKGLGVFRAALNQVKIEK